MKKIILLPVIALMFSCGQSAEEKAKLEQAHKDSIKAAQDMVFKNAIDSIEQYGQQEQTNYDTKISLVKHGLSKDVVDKMTTEQLDSTLKYEATK